MTEEMLTIKEVAKYLRMGLITTYKLVQDGKIPAFKVGKQWRIKKDDLLKYIELQKLAPRRTRKNKQIEIMEYLGEEEKAVQTEKENNS